MRKLLRIITIVYNEETRLHDFKSSIILDPKVGLACPKTRSQLLIKGQGLYPREHEREVILPLTTFFYDEDCRIGKFLDALFQRDDNKANLESKGLKNPDIYLDNDKLYVELRAIMAKDENTGELYAGSISTTLVANFDAFECIIPLDSRRLSSTVYETELYIRNTFKDAPLSVFKEYSNAMKNRQIVSTGIVKHC